MEKLKKITCIACKETIREGAVICPHCGRQQTRTYLHLLGDGLKWAAGIAALLTLIISASELNKIMGHWLENEQAVNEYADAAKLLAHAGDHVNAQQLLQQATQLNPASAKVRDLRISLAQEKLRTFALLDRNGHYMLQLTVKKDDSGLEIPDFEYSRANDTAFEKLKVNELVPLFARGIVSSHGPAKATLLAHLGWMDLLRESGLVHFNIDTRFREALYIDPDNPYANAMFGAWLLSPRNRSTVKIDKRVEKAHEHFSKALSSHKESSWVKALWLEALIKADGSAADHDLLRVLQSFRDAGEPLAKYGPAFIALKTNFINTASNGRAPDESNEERFQSLLSAFSVEDLLIKLNWLSAHHYGCEPGPGCEKKNHDMQNILYISGRLHEIKKDLDNAIEAYRLAQTERYRKWFVDDVVMQHLEEVLEDKGVTSKRMLANWDARWTTLQNKDVILEYHGKKISNADELSEVNSQLEPDNKVIIKVLRQGMILELKSEPLQLNSVVSYVIPVSLLKPDKANSLKDWLTNE